MASSYRKPIDLLHELGITEPEEIRIEPIAEFCGATIVYEPLDGCAARIVGFGDRAIITVNSNSSPGRQRFSGGHELGHWMCDRGKVAFACEEESFTMHWTDTTPEQRANRYAVDLLLPEFMFQPLVANQEATFATAERLATRFSTSLTATAIRLVELGSFPAMIICTEKGKRRWFVRGPAVPDILWPHNLIDHHTVASQLLTNQKSQDSPGPLDVQAHHWIEHPDSFHYRIVEDSLRVSRDLVLTLLWWMDEKQILDLDSDDELD